MLLTADGQTLVVANGGIETHPDYGRTELNLDTMDPSLVFIDAASGDLVGQLQLAAGLHRLSIRHMAFDSRQTVWFGCQFRGAPDRQPQLVGSATRDGDIGLLDLPPESLGALRNYVGSVAASRDGRRIAVSSPAGNIVLAFDTASGTPVGTLRLIDGCGIAPDAQGFRASSGQGEIAGLAGSGAGRVALEVDFDDHLRRLWD